MCENEILLSFIIPVYNVEMYLQDCLDSLLPQTTDECEIILINDGSTDSSGEICRGYEEKNKIIKVIEQKNGGLSSARNAGIAASKGRYITFIDSDDKIYPDSISAVLSWIKSEDSDLCFLNAFKFFSDGSTESLGEGIERDYLRLQHRENAVRYLASRAKFPGSAWAKLYKKDFILNNNLHFPYDRRYSEDLGFMLDCILKADSFDALDVPYYLYRQNREGSITNKITSKNFYDLMLFVAEATEKLTVNEEPVDTVSGFAMSFVAYEYSILLFHYSFFQKDERKDALVMLKKYKWVLKYATDIKVKVISLFCRVLGIRLTSAVVHQYRKAIER